jgi:hypothetical protein
VRLIHRTNRGLRSTRLKAEDTISVTTDGYALLRRKGETLLFKPKTIKGQHPFDRIPKGRLFLLKKEPMWREKVCHIVNLIAITNGLTYKAVHAILSETLHFQFLSRK